MTTGKEIIDKIKSIKGTADTQDPNVERNRGTVTGALTGLLVGLYYGYAKKKNLIACGLVGAVLGGIITRVCIKK